MLEALGHLEEKVSNARGTEGGGVVGLHIYPHPSSSAYSRHPGLGVNLDYGHIICGCHITWLYIRVTGKWVSGPKRDMGEGILILMLVFHGILGNSLTPIFLLSLETGHNNIKTTEPSNEVEMHKRITFLCDRSPILCGCCQLPSILPLLIILLQRKPGTGHGLQCVSLALGYGKETQNPPKNPRGKLGVWERVVSKETNNTWLNVSDF